MELPTKIQSLLKADAQGFLQCSGKEYQKLLKSNQQKQSLKLLQSIIDGLGSLSAHAQSLKQIITNSIKFLGTDHRIYIKVKDNKALGFIKVGEKNLFYRDFIGNIKQLKPTCILDFYVHQSCQRSGIGKQIFEKFLRSQAKIPEKLAYDRPSEKLIGFLKKHYGLAKFISQNNNYVIFDKYFNKQMPNLATTITKVQPPSIKPPLSQTSQSFSNSNIKVRPKSYIPVQKIEQPQKVEKIEKLNTTQKTKEHSQKKQLQQLSTFYQNQNLRATMKHKNTTSQGFPLSTPLIDNPAFKTTSNAYGNYYRKNKF